MVVLAAASPPGAYAMCMCRASDDDLAAEGERFSKRFGAALDEIIEIRDRAKLFFNNLNSVEPDRSDNRGVRLRPVLPDTMSQRVSLATNIVSESKHIP